MLIDMTYLAMGSSMLACVFIWSRFASKAFFSPYAIYMCALFIHMFPDPVMRHEIEFMSSSLWGTISEFNLICYVSAVLGVFMASILFPAVKTRRALPSLGILSGYNKINMLYAIVFVLLMLGLLLLVLSGGIGNQRGIYRGYDGAPLSFATSKILINYNLSSAIIFVLLVVFNHIKSMKMALVFLSPAFIIFVTDILARGRGAVLTVLVTVLIAIVARFDRFPLKYTMYAALGGGFVVAISLLRAFQVPVSEIPTADIFIHIYENIVYSIITTIPGQEVFRITLSGFNPETDGFFWGLTYFYDLLLAMRLEFLVPDSYQTPAYWFAGNFLSEDSYGRDFSMVAEAYINFGFWGAGVFFIIGFLSVYFSRVIYRSNSIVLVAFAAFMVVNFIIGLRNDSLALFTRAIFYFAPILLYHYSYVLLTKILPRK